jgi:hypothetical protein
LLALYASLRFEASHRRGLWPDQTVAVLEGRTRACDLTYTLTRSTARHLNDWEHRFAVTYPGNAVP